jgi:predicted DNA-binding transcriptional regulator AlpA
VNNQTTIIRRTAAPSVVGLSLATIDRLRREGRFVPSVRLAEKAVGFLKSDLDAWLAGRKEAAQ